MNSRFLLIGLFGQAAPFFTALEDITELLIVDRNFIKGKNVLFHNGPADFTVTAYFFRIKLSKLTVTFTYSIQFKNSLITQKGNYMFFLKLSMFLQRLTVDADACRQEDFFCSGLY